MRNCRAGPLPAALKRMTGELGQTDDLSRSVAAGNEILHFFIDSHG